MAAITFKGKVQQVYNIDETVAYSFIKVPDFTRSHCDMHAFRRHPKYGGLANSDLFPNILARIKRDIFKGNTLRLDNVPDGVHIDTSGFLAVVTFEA